jgi:TonB family protein
VKRFLLTAAIFIASASSSLANDHAAEQQVLDSGRKPADLFQGNWNPFILEIDFTSQNRGSVPGHFSAKWQSKDHWWSKVSVGGFEQTTIRNGEMEYTVRSFGYTPTMVQELFRLLGFDVSSTGLAATGQKDRTVDGISSTCIEIQANQFRGHDREFCFGTGSHELLREDWEVGQGGKNIETFADYSAFDKTAYPRKFTLLKNGEESISAVVTTLANAAFDPALLAPSKGAIERRKCAGLQPPIPIERLMPVISRPGIEGHMTASLTILTDGSVGDVEILHSGGSAMDKAALEAFKKSTFKPAMCGADPVVSDIEMSETVRHN